MQQAVKFVQVSVALLFTGWVIVMMHSQYGSSFFRFTREGIYPRSKILTLQVYDKVYELPGDLDDKNGRHIRVAGSSMSWYCQQTRDACHLVCAALYVHKRKATVSFRRLKLHVLPRLLGWLE